MNLKECIIIREIHPLWVGLIIFLVSLFGAWITFGLLESTGTVEDERIKLGGAVAGFIVILLLFFRSYHQLMEESLKFKLVEESSKLDIGFKLMFPEEDESNVKFTKDVHGSYVIKNGNMKIYKGKLVLEFKDFGGYSWKPPVKIAPNWQITLTLKDDDGKKWKVIERPVQGTIPLTARLVGGSK